jgi:hypothetical protein
MPVLDDAGIAELLALAHTRRRCVRCGHHPAMDYCRTCDEYFWIHAPGCFLYAPEHHGHPSYLIPFVEERA